MDLPDLSKEFSFKTSRSSGSGGQHVNKVSTRVVLIFNVNNSQLLSIDQKDLILENLSERINKKGEIQVSCQETRSQASNKEIAVEKFLELISSALTEEKERIPTSIPLQIDRKRIEEKKRRSETKARRKNIPPADNE